MEDDIIDKIDDYCRRHDVHFCCLICENKCRCPESLWSGCMPCTEYCEDFKIDPFWEWLFKKV